MNANSLILLKFLDMKHNVPAVARCSQKTVEAPGTANRLFNKPLSQCPKRHCFQSCLDLSGLPCLLNFRLMFKSQVQSRQSGRCVAQAIKLGNTGGQDKVVGNVVHAPR